MSLKHGLLGLLNYGSMSGYDLDKAFKDSLDYFWHAQTSQVYRELNTMNNNGWVTCELIYQDDKPNKKVYTITQIGKSELIQWLSHFDMKDGLNIRSTFLLKLFFSGLRTPKENIDVLEKFKKACNEQLKEMAATDDLNEKYSKYVDGEMDALYWKSTSLFGYYYYEMCIKWADDIISKINNKQ